MATLVAHAAAQRQFDELVKLGLPPNGGATAAMALGDVDGDGDRDLVLGNREQQQILLYLNDGTGTFVDATTTRLSAEVLRTRSVVLADVDADGDLDLLLGNEGQRNRLYVNLQRQIEAPFVLRIGRAYQLDVYARYGPVGVTPVALPFLATATANLPLPPIGTIRLDPTRMVALPLVQIPQPTGVGSLSCPVPDNRSLAGVAIHAQALIVHGSVSMRLTNRSTEIVLR